MLLRDLIKSLPSANQCGIDYGVGYVFKVMERPEIPVSPWDGHKAVNETCKIIEFRLVRTGQYSYEWDLIL